MVFFTYLFICLYACPFILYLFIHSFADPLKLTSLPTYLGACCLFYSTKNIFMYALYMEENWRGKYTLEIQVSFVLGLVCCQVKRVQDLSHHVVSVSLSVHTEQSTCMSFIAPGLATLFSFSSMWDFQRLCFHICHFHWLSIHFGFELMFTFVQLYF